MRSGTPKATDDILCSILSSVHMWAGIGISVTIFIIILLFVICYLFSWYFYHHYHNGKLPLVCYQPLFSAAWEIVKMVLMVVARYHRSSFHCSMFI